MHLGFWMLVVIAHQKCVVCRIYMQTSSFRYV